MFHHVFSRGAFDLTCSTLVNSNSLSFSLSFCFMTDGELKNKIPSSSKMSMLSSVFVNHEVKSGGRERERDSELSGRRLITGDREGSEPGIGSRMISSSMAGLVQAKFSNTRSYTSTYFLFVEYFWEQAKGNKRIHGSIHRVPFAMLLFRRSIFESICHEVDPLSLSLFRTQSLSGTPSFFPCQCTFHKLSVHLLRLLRFGFK